MSAVEPVYFHSRVKGIESGEIQTPAAWNLKDRLKNATVCMPRAGRFFEFGLAAAS